MPLRIDNTDRNKIFKGRATDEQALKMKAGDSVKAIGFSRKQGKRRENVEKVVMVPSKGGLPILCFRTGTEQVLNNDWVTVA